jgi:hypothetical protein
MNSENKIPERIPRIPKIKIYQKEFQNSENKNLPEMIPEKIL